MFSRYFPTDVPCEQHSSSRFSRTWGGDSRNLFYCVATTNNNCIAVVALVHILRLCVNTVEVAKRMFSCIDFSTGESRSHAAVLPCAIKSSALSEM